MAPHSSTFAWKIPWTEEPDGLQSMGSRRVGHDWATSLSLFTFMHWRKEMATHSSVLAWRIPGMGEPGGLPSMGLHRVGHDWCDLVAAAAVKHICYLCKTDSQWEFAVWSRELNLVLCDNLGGAMGWEVEGRFKRERTYVYGWLIHVWQKPIQHCKATILQLKINKSRNNRKKWEATNWSLVSHNCFIY